MRKILLPVIIALPFAIGGCASTIADVVTAPVKVISKTADVLTTSQSESDEKRGRAMRKKEENLGKLARKRDKAQKKCDGGNQKACDEAELFNLQIKQEQDRDI